MCYQTRSQLYNYMAIVQSVVDEVVKLPDPHHTDTVCAIHCMNQLSVSVALTLPCYMICTMILM